MTKISEILKSIRPEFDFENVEDFLEAGMLDSFDVVSLVGALETSYEIKIRGVDIVPENFRSERAIGELLTRYEARP